MTLEQPFRYSIYDAPLPQEIEIRLVDLYQSAFSVKEYFEMFKKINDYKTLVIYSENDNPKHIICFCINKKDITVLNEVFYVDYEYVSYLSDVLFKEYPQINKINLNRIRCDVEKISCLYRLWTTSNDVVIKLPATIGEYEAKLGRKTRQNLKRHYKRLQQTYDDYKFNIAVTHEIEPSLISKIIEMNRLRMKSKKVRSGIDSIYEESILKFSKNYGQVGTINVNGQVIAGSICYDMGSHCFGETISHDNNYNESRVGQICLYLTLKHLIEKGVSYYHMMEGENDYKYRFLGDNQELYSISIFRSKKYKLFGIIDVLKFKYSKLCNLMSATFDKYSLSCF